MQTEQSATHKHGKFPDLDPKLLAFESNRQKLDLLEEISIEIPCLLVIGADHGWFHPNKRARSLGIPIGRLILQVLLCSTSIVTAK